jgi:pyruvate/2-oxoglutarate dehydrogenase complex dihydrolipoamide acyltransferase (E2) component
LLLLLATLAVKTNMNSFAAFFLTKALVLVDCVLVFQLLRGVVNFGNENNDVVASVAHSVAAVAFLAAASFGCVAYAALDHAFGTDWREVALGLADSLVWAVGALLMHLINLLRDEDCVMIMWGHESFLWWLLHLMAGAAATAPFLTAFLSSVTAGEFRLDWYTPQPTAAPRPAPRAASRPVPAALAPAAPVQGHVEYDEDEDDGEGGPEEDLNTFSFEEVQASLERLRRLAAVAPAVRARALPKTQAPRPSARSAPAAAKKVPSKARAAASKKAPAAGRPRREAAAAAAAKKVPPKAPSTTSPEKRALREAYVLRRREQQRFARASLDGQIRAGVI